MKKYVAYFRVSTKGQIESGLGLDGQRKAVLDFTKNCQNCIIAEYTEREKSSGKNDNRAELLKAIDYAKRNDAILLIAKLDRLSRNASFIFTLRDTGVNFLCCDMPDANNLTIGIFAVLAQHERELISSRTKAALEARKEKFGEWRKGVITSEARQRAMNTIKEKAKNNENTKRATNYAKSLRESGLTLQKIADRLNNETFRTPNGGMFCRKTVSRVLLKVA